VDQLALWDHLALQVLKVLRVMLVLLGTEDHLDQGDLMELLEHQEPVGSQGLRV